MIQPHQFHNLLDCLAGQFFSTNEAICVGNEFGIQLSLAAKSYFSVAIIPDTLPHNKVVLGVLLDDSVRVPSRNGYTFVIYIDKEKIYEPLYKILVSMILAHETCHFAFYYELFIKLGDNTGIVTHSKFAHTVSVKLIGAVTQEQDNTSQTITDEHDIEDLAKNFRKYSKKHFSKGRDTSINYKEMIDNFFEHLYIGKMIKEYLDSRAIQQP